MKAGLASQYLAVGDLLDIPLKDGTVMKRRVLGFSDQIVQINGVERTVPAIRMDNYNLYSIRSNFYTNDSIGNVYPSSSLRNTINTTIQGLESEEFLSCLGNTKVPYWAKEGTVLTVYDKLFPPSLEELGQTPSDEIYKDAQREAEGPTPSYYTQSRDHKRYVHNDPTGVSYWTRSVFADNLVYRIIIDDTGTVTIFRNSNLAYILVQFDFIGKY